MSTYENDEFTKPAIKPGMYVPVFLALLALTGATLCLSQVDLGEWHAAVGLTIAAAKALLIVLFFMHILHGARMIWVIALSGLAWLSILMILTLTDYLSRSWLTY